MVFKQKLPAPTPPKRTSVRRLAKNLGVELASVLEALQEIGEYVSSPATNSLESPTVRAVCSYLGVPYERDNDVRSVPPWKIRDETSRFKRPVSVKTSTFAPSNYPYTRFDPKDTSAGLGDPRHDTRAAWASEEWKLYDFSEIERDVWISHGLRPGQAKLAKRLREAGLTAPDLQVQVEGWSVAKRMRAGEPLKDIFRLLQEHPDSDAS